MKPAIAVLLCASLALAEPPADAPLDEPGRALVLEQGEFAPYRGVLLDEQEAVRRERARVRAEVALETAQQGLLLPRGALIALIAGCVAASAAIAAGVTYAATKRAGP